MKNYLFELYRNKKNLDDLEIVPFKDKNGFSIIRKYPKNSKFFKENYFIYIQIEEQNNDYLFFSVERVKKDKDGYYLDLENKEKVTNFVSTEDEKFLFDKNKKIIKRMEDKKTFTLEQFINILVKNHLSDKFFWKRKINYLIDLLFIFIFLLNDKKYNKFEVLIKRNNFGEREIKKLDVENKDPEPFFKYFRISKNLLFLTLFLLNLFLIFFNKKFKFIDFSVSNPIIIITALIYFFLLEKINYFLEKNIKEFLDSSSNILKAKNNFLEKLYSYQSKNKFKLII